MRASLSFAMLLMSGCSLIVDPLSRNTYDRVPDAGCPSAAESCNGADDDCDGMIDEGLLMEFWLDADGDSFGTGAPQMLCMVEGDVVATRDGDCDDSTNAVNPGATETCDGLDDDCDPTTWGPGEDDDADGFADADCGGDDCYDMFDDVAPDMCDVVDLAAGGHSTVAVFRRTDGSSEARWWGENGWGVLGPGGTARADRPTPFPLTDPMDVEVSFGIPSSSACAIDVSGDVWCWGSNSNGQLGQGSSGGQFDTPVRVAGLAAASDLATGNRHACAATASGLYCWGYGFWGQIGDAGNLDRPAPTMAMGLTSASAVTAGALHTCAVSLGALYCWGQNSNSKLGDGSTTDRNVPTRIGTDSDWTDASAAEEHSCALRSNAYCWGEGSRLGTVPTGPLGTTRRPVLIPGFSGTSQIVASTNHSCLIDSTGAAFCWGPVNSAGQIGDGTLMPRSMPTPVTGLIDATQIALGYYHSCALRRTGQIVCWGENGRNQSGDGTVDVHLTPSPIHP